MTDLADLPILPTLCNHRKTRVGMIMEALRGSMIIKLSLPFHGCTNVPNKWITGRLNNIRFSCIVYGK